MDNQVLTIKELTQKLGISEKALMDKIEIKETKKLGEQNDIIYEIEKFQSNLIEKILQLHCLLRKLIDDPSDQNKDIVNRYLEREISLESAWREIK